MKLFVDFHRELKMTAFGIKTNESRENFAWKKLKNQCEFEEERRQKQKREESIFSFLQ